MPVIPLGYPLDLTATATTNFIQNEVVTFNTVQEKMFVPSKGPFYTLSMEIRHGVTNALLQPETQYKLLQPVKEAIRMSGKEVCAVVYITDNSIPSITISYRVIGGVFSDTASEIRNNYSGVEFDVEKFQEFCKELNVNPMLIGHVIEAIFFAEGWGNSNGSGHALS